MRQIITRSWHGMTKAIHADEYIAYLKETGLADYAQTPGNLGVEVWRRMEGDICHFWTVTRWLDYDSIKKFAGEDYEKAKYYPQDQNYLLAFEETVSHYETFTDF